MKKIIGMILAVSMAISMTAAVNAENNPSVYLDGARIDFEDQQPVILGEGTTLVPARGVFEAMGADVQWDGEKRQVRIDSDDNKTRIYLIIDNPDMSVWKFTSIFAADETVVNLDVAPQIINDRTMIPLRAVSEAMGADVQWDGEKYSVIIKSAEYEDYAPPEDPETPAGNNVKTGMTITSSTDSVSAGDTVDIYVNILNLPSDAYLSGITSLVSYSTEDFEYQGCSLYRNGQDVESSSEDENVPSALSADNPNYYDNAVKAVMITIDKFAETSGPVARLTFKALTSKGGEFALLDSYDMLRGYNNSFTFTKNDGSKIYGVSGNDLYLDTTPVKVSGK